MESLLTEYNAYEHQRWLRCPESFEKVIDRISEPIVVDEKYKWGDPFKITYFYVHVVNQPERETAYIKTECLEDIPAEYNSVVFYFPYFKKWMTKFTSTI